MAENENKQPAGSRRMEILQQSLVKKQAAIDRVNNADIPDFLKPMIESGEITQWRKFPNRPAPPGTGAQDHARNRKACAGESRI